MKKVEQKKEYKTPDLKELGKLEDLTKGGGSPLPEIADGSMIL